MSKMFPLASFFPDQIGTPRQGQLDVFQKLDYTIDDPDQKFYMIDAPVGTGKSAIVASLLRYFEREDVNSLVLTPLKYLQDQYSEVYPDIPNIKGRANYPCPVLGGDVTAATAVCAATAKCREAKQNPVLCPYYATRDAALAHPYFVSNFRYFLLAKKLILGAMPGAAEFIKKRSVLIIDEAHTIQDELLSILPFKLTTAMYGRTPPLLPSIKDYVPVITDSMHNINDQLEECAEELMSYGIDVALAGVSLSAANLPPTAQKALSRLRRLESTLHSVERFLLSVAQGKQWVSQPRDEGKYGKSVEFKPLYVGDFTNQYLFRHFDKVILLSGTFMSAAHFAQEIGIADQSYMYTQIPHPFPVDNRKIYLDTSIGSMTAGAQGSGPQKTTLPLMVTMLGKLMQHYTGKKGIVFTVSGKLQESLLQGMRSQFPHLAHRILSATPDNKEEVLRQHYEAHDTVLFTTSLWQGVDLKDDLSRFQVFVKVPYLDFGDARIKKLANSDRNWYHMQTAKIFCQGYGRSIRTETDYADTWILDQSFSAFYEKAQHIFPVWFQEALIPVGPST